MGKGRDATNADEAHRTTDRRAAAQIASTVENGCMFFEIVEKLSCPAPARAIVRRIVGDPTRGQKPPRQVMSLQSDPDLPQVILALSPPGRLASCLNRRQKHRHQEADDADHDQQFDQRKRSAAGRHTNQRAGDDDQLRSGATAQFWGDSRRNATIMPLGNVSRLRNDLRAVPATIVSDRINCETHTRTRRVDVL